MKRSFTIEEDAVLEELYPVTYMGDLCEKLQRSEGSIRWRARQLGLKRPNIRKPKLNVLLEESVLNAYWWGLIYSDGHLTDNSILKVKLWKRDSEYLNGLASYLGVKTRLEANGSMVVIETQDKINGPRLKEKLGMKKRKTENPPDSLNFLTSDENIVAFLVGLIDGDGNVGYRRGKFQSIRIQMHGSWKPVLDELAERLKGQGFRASTSIDCRGASSMLLCGRDQYERLKLFIEEHNLPTLKRKWIYYEDCD